MVQNQQEWEIMGCPGLFQMPRAAVIVCSLMLVGGPLSLLGAEEMPGESPMPASSPAEKDLFVAPELSEEEKTVSIEQASEFARRVEETYRGTTELPLIDAGRLMALSTNGLKIPDGDIRNELTELMNSEVRTWTAAVRSYRSEGYHYSLQKVFEREGRRFVRFRFISPTGSGLSFHEYQLVNLGGNIIAEEMISLDSGEPITKTLNRNIFCYLEDQKRGPIEKFFDLTPPKVKISKTIMQLTVGQGTSPEEKVRLYETLSPAGQKEIVAAASYLRALQKIPHLNENKDRYLRVLDTLVEDFPNSPALHLHSTTPLLSLGEFDRCERSVDFLNKYLEGEPYLNLPRAVLAIKANEPNRAANLSLQLIHDFPSASWAHFVAIGILQETDENDAVLKILISTEKNGHAKFPYPLDVNKDSMGLMKRFLQSPQFEEFEDYLRQRNTEQQPPDEAVLAE